MLARRNLIVGFLIMAIGTGVGFLMGNSVGWGWLIGSGIAFIASIMTVLVMIATEKLAVRNEWATMAGSYLIKAILIIGVLYTLSGYSFYSKPALGGGFLISLLGCLVIDVVTILRTRHDW